MRGRQPCWRNTRRNTRLSGFGRGMRRGLRHLQDIAAVAVVDGGAGGHGGLGGSGHHVVGNGDDGGWVIGLAASNDGICRSFFRSL